MDYDASTLARRISAELTDLDPELPDKVDLILAQSQQKRDKYTEIDVALGLASLVISIAAFAHQIMKTDKREQNKDNKEQLTIMLEEGGHQHSDTLDRVIEVTVKITQTSGNKR